MPSGRNMPSMPQVLAWSGSIGTTCRPISLSRTSAVSSLTNAMVVEISRPSEPFSTASNAESGGTRGTASALRRRRALVQVFHLRRVGRRNVERQLLELVVGDRHAEVIAHVPDRLEIQLLQLVRRVLRLAVLAQAVALDGLGEDHRGLALVLRRRRVRGVDLVRVVAAAVEAPDVLVGHAGDPLQELW